VSDAVFNRMEKDLEDLQVRLRNIENLDTRATRQLLADVQTLEARVDRIDQQGSVAAGKDIDSMRRTLKRHEDSITTKADASLVQEMRDDTKSNRRIVVAAIVGTAFSIGAWLIQWLITRGHP
jgi:hypothetical protein